ncbi:MAG: glycogen/starch synthase [Thermodesulfobacteriota bacterium]|nr:glycogen/starch synthase [Thermodesulfobacteriota bacterium]
MKEQKYPLKTIWMISREYDGLAGAGGVKDVCRQLAEALVAEGKNVSVILPFYGFMKLEETGFRLFDSFQVDMNYVGVERREQVQIWIRQHEDKPTIYLVDAARYQEKKSVYTYTAEDEAEDPAHVQGTGHYDYFAMNVLLQKTAIDLMLCLGEKVDLIHCHDGHTALLPAMIKENEGYRHYFRKTGLVVTIHNAGLGYHQEVADLPFAKVVSGLPGKVLARNLLKGSFDPFLAASSYAVLNTVSENYARELRETDDDELTGFLGHILLSRGVTLEGVTNGISPADFDTREHEKLGIDAGYSVMAGDFAGKIICRQKLIQDINGKKLTHVQQNGSLTQADDVPLLTLIGRLTAQKGVDKLIGALETLLPTDKEFQVLILGSGIREIEDGLLRLTKNSANKGRVCLLRGYDPGLANRIYAAGDFFLVPSRYEPCGLTDYIAQLFGNLPIVHHIGGLVKVIDGKTGFTYQDHSSAALMGAMQKAIRVYRKQNGRIKEMQLQAVTTISEKYTWKKIVHRYLHLYGKALDMAG